MPIAHYDGKDYVLEEAETLLEALLRNGIEYPHSCKSGTCQSCLTKLTSGEVNPDAQQGLKPTQVAQNCFLACQCKPKDDIAIELPNQAATRVEARIEQLSKLNHNVLQVKLSLADYSSFHAGQYINLVTPDNHQRSYSIANIPEDEQCIELHIKLIPGGKMNEWLSNAAKVGSSVHVGGPMGDCFYANPDNASFPIVLAGTGTGLAPLLGIAADALKHNHNGKIQLIHGGVSKVDLYLHETLKNLENLHENFSYLPCTLDEDSTVQQGSIEKIVAAQLDGIAKEARLFICGPEETTKKIKMKAFMAGVPSASIYSDAFIQTS